MKTIIVDHEPKHFHSIEKEILYRCPQLDISGYASNSEEACKLIDEVKPKLVFMEVNVPDASAIQILNKSSYNDFETIFVAHSSRRDIGVVKSSANGYFLKPLKAEEIIDTVGIVEEGLSKREKDSSQKENPFVKRVALFPENIISIPTMEGLDFIPVKEIIRCEGFQRCTRIVTIDRSDILSSYPIGFFKKRLEEHLFYLTHKSHLINLSHIRKYLKEGSIKMTDGTFVPVSKRRKSDFLRLSGIRV